MPCTAALRRRGARLGSRTTQRDELRPLHQEPNDELDEPVLAPFAPVPQPGDSDKERATADEDAHGAERRVPSTTCHAPTPIGPRTSRQPTWRQLDASLSSMRPTSEPQNGSPRLARRDCP